MSHGRPPPRSGFEYHGLRSTATAAQIAPVTPTIYEGTCVERV